MNKVLMIKTAVALAAAVLLAGCADESARTVNLNLKYITTDSTPEPSVDKNAQAQLAETATATNASLQTLSAIQVATHPKVKLQSPLNADAIGLGQVASVNWTGPAASLLQKVANASNYKLQILGNVPAIPVIAQVDVKEQTMAAIVRNIAYQVFNKATVTIYPSSKTIELRYRTI